MPNPERQRKRECSQSGCRYFDRCKVFHGNECKELFGNKIPHMRYASEARPPIESQLASKFKPFFMEATDTPDMEEVL